MTSILNYLNENTENTLDLVGIFQEIIRKIKSKFGYDLSYIKLQISEIPVYNDGRPNKKMNPDEFGGSWTKNKTIYINKNIPRVIKYWKLKMSEETFARIIISHELGHELYKNFNISHNHIPPKDFTTPYLKTVIPEKYKEEAFCEYFAHQIVYS